MKTITLNLVAVLLSATFTTLLTASLLAIIKLL